MAALISINEFINKLKEGQFSLLDVRSEAEYLHAHVPGACNMPLLNNGERVEVGTLYKQKGREAAVKKGFELVGPRFAAMITEAEKIAPGRDLLIYCWRGGMRSNIMAWLLNMAGFRIHLLKGGYKEFRHWVLEQFNNPRKMMVLGGKTGTGKTELLKAILAKGEQIIDLEGLAHHKGSAFGSLGQLPQPSNEQFENKLAMLWHEADPDRLLWLENESRSVGSNTIPLGVFSQMRNSTVVEVILNREIRKKRILEEYGKFSVEILEENTRKLAKRLGGKRLKDSLAFLQTGQLNEWVEIMLEYYDQTYQHSNEQRAPESILTMELDHDRMDENASRILEMVYRSGKQPARIC